MSNYYAGNENPSMEENGSYIRGDGQISYQHESSNHFVKSLNDDDQGDYYDGEEDFEEDDGSDVKRKPSDASDESNYSSLLGPPKKRRVDETPDRTNAIPSLTAGRQEHGGLQPSPNFGHGHFGALSMPAPVQSNGFEMWQNHGGMSPAFSYPATHYLPSIGAPAMPAAQNNTPNATAEQKISGMTPLVFSGMPHAMPHAGYQYPSNAMAFRNVVNAEGQIQQIYQVVSSDSQGDVSNVAAPAPMPLIVHNGMLMSAGPGLAIPLQQPKKWVRWSEQEDQHLRRAVTHWGENNFKMISESVFHGARSEVQCKNRWKKALQPGLVKGRWTKEEDDIILDHVQRSNGNVKWAEIAKMLPGRIGEQVKERWVNTLDPDVKKGVWSAHEMNVLINAQKELGNRWSEIAKLIPGRSENSVKNRWYNQKTSEKRAQKKARELGQHGVVATSTHSPDEESEGYDGYEEGEEYAPSQQHDANHFKTEGSEDAELPVDSEEV